MSSEFFADIDKDTFDVQSVSQAINVFKERMSWHTDISAFVSKIKTDYDSFPGGKDELAHVLSVASVLARLNTDDPDGNANAVFEGQLIGMQLLNYAASDSAPVMHIARPYLERQILQHLNSQDVSYASHLVERLHADLSTRKGHCLLPEDQEAFVMEISNQLYPGLEQAIKAEFASIGIRLIMSEAYQASVDTLEAAEYEKNYNIPTTTSTTMLDGHGDAREDFTDLEPNNIKFDHEVVTKFFDRERNAFRSLERLEPSQAGGILMHIENQINQRNATESWLKPGQTVQINGIVFALHAEPGMKPPEFIDVTTDIIGKFGEFVVVTAPTNDALFQYQPGRQPDKDATQLAVAIRIKDPLLVHYGLDGQDTSYEKFDRFERSDDRTGQTFDIPLSYLGLNVSTFNTL